MLMFPWHRTVGGSQFYESGQLNSFMNKTNKEDQDGGVRMANGLPQ